MRRTIYKMSSMRGLGDNIYQRAFIKKIAEKDLVLIDTPWPEIYQDLPNVFFSQCNTELRTQKKNVKKTDYCGRRCDNLATTARQGARIANLGNIRYLNEGILVGMKEKFKVDPLPMDLPSFQASDRIAELITKKYALIRPVTVRKEWHSDARNPLPEYLIEAVEILKKRGFITVSIADVDGTNEKFVGEAPACDIEFNKGELSIRELLCLTEHAALVVGGIGWAVPAAMAYKKKAVFICGGWGEFNHPDRLQPSEPVPSVHFLKPDKFCMCRDSAHNCNKTITNFKGKFDELAA